VRRSVRRSLATWSFALLVLAGVGAWAWQGAFTLKPGEAAVLLLLAFRARMELPPGHGLLTGLLPLFALTVAMSAVVWGVDLGLQHVLPPALLGSTTLAVGVRVALGIGVGSALYLVIAMRLCPAEWAALRPLLRRGR